MNKTFTMLFSLLPLTNPREGETVRRIKGKTTKNRRSLEIFLLDIYNSPIE